METKLTNIASVLGNYNDIPTSISTQALVVTMIDGLTATKTADKMIWADGNLTYTITVNNESTETYTAPVITDILETTLISFITGSITIDDTPIEESEYTYDQETGTLTIKLPDIAPSSKKTVTFQVAKKS